VSAAEMEFTTDQHSYSRKEIGGLEANNKGAYFDRLVKQTRSIPNI